jgi:hypothetical protein
MPNRWQKFLKDNGGKGHTQEQLRELYNEKYGDTPTKKQKAKNPSSAHGERKATYVVRGPRGGPSSPKYKIEYVAKGKGKDDDDTSYGKSPRTGGVNGRRGSPGRGFGGRGYGGRGYGGRGYGGYGRRGSGFGAGLLLGGLAGAALTYPRPIGYSSYCWNYYNTYGYFPAGCGPGFRYRRPVIYY